LRELWTGIQYNDVGSIPTETPPDGTSVLTLFEDPANYGDNYGTRVSGYICPPATGNYTFWIASNDHSELWLSTDDNRSNRRLIAYVAGHTNPRQWNKFSTQESLPIQLVTGQRYYIEALHKEGIGTDHMAVGWQLPDGTLERPIPGNRLTPYEGQTFAMNGFGAFTEMNTTTGSEVEVFPNPAESNTQELTITASNEWEDGHHTTVEIHRMTGEVVYSTTIDCAANCGDYPLPMAGTLQPGVYLVKIVSNGKRTAKRLLVR